MDQSEVLKFEQQKVGTILLSEAIRECGYGNPLSFSDCVIGRAYVRIIGHRIVDANWSGLPEGSGFRTALKVAARDLETPFSILKTAEQMCFDHRPPSEIAAFVASEGY